MILNTYLRGYLKIFLTACLSNSYINVLKHQTQHLNPCPRNTLHTFLLQGLFKRLEGRGSSITPLRPIHTSAEIILGPTAANVPLRRAMRWPCVTSWPSRRGHLVVPFFPVRFFSLLSFSPVSFSLHQLSYYSCSRAGCCSHTKNINCG